MTPLQKLYAKLCRELAQSEHSAVVHTRFESRRLRDVPPAAALDALGAHARALRPWFDALMSKRQPIGAIAGRSVGELFSLLRNVLFDRIIDDHAPCAIEKRLTPSTPCMLQGFVVSSGPTNIS